MPWIMTTNETCTEFYAKSTDYKVQLKADNWTDLYCQVANYMEFLENLPEDE